MRRGRGRVDRDVSRRDFLGLAGRAGMGALAFMFGGAMPLSAQTPGTRPVPRRTGVMVWREFHLEAHRINWELAPGRFFKVHAFNGQVPGPEIRVREGDMVRVHMDNDIPDQELGLHWHGVDEILMPTVPIAIPDEPVGTGDEFVYEFEAKPSGTRWYHPSHHWPGVVQMDSGLFGPMVFEPLEGEPFPFDREYTLSFDDWATGTGPVLPGTWGGTAAGGAGGGMGSMPGLQMMGGMMRGPRTMPYDLMTINGKAYPLTKPLVVRQGEVVRLRMLNPSNYLTHVIRLANHRLYVTHTDGNPLLQPVEVDALPITVSERYDVNFVADRPGTHFLYCAQPGHAAAGEMVPVVYEGFEGIAPAPPMPVLAGLRVWHYALGRGRDVIPPPTGQLRNFQMTLMGQPMTDGWTINGKQYPRVYDKWVVNVGDLVRVQIVNMTMQNHP
ncbi:MAG: multicopper oxidase family protein, partial [Candidatus Entotheonellia bacterium]